MDITFFPPEGLPPEGSHYQRRCQDRHRLAAILAIAMVVGASLALVTASEVASPVTVPVSQ